jgi:uncharacterized phage-associated protein
MYNTIYLSNNLLLRAFRENITVTPMKLQKMMYFIYRDYLKEIKEPLFTERFMTWKYGPVLDSVYTEYKRYRGGTPIKRYGNFNGVYAIDEGTEIELSRFLTDIWNKCRLLGAVELSRLTHKEGSAWYAAFQKNAPLLVDEDILLDNIVIA